MNGNHHKNNIRKQLKNVRGHLTPKQVNDCSQIICSKISKFEFFKAAKKIALYMPVCNEVSLLSLLNFNKQFFLPVLQKDFSLQFFAFQPGDITHQNQFNINEPSLQKSPIDINELDIILIPLVGFSRQGQRLGMGQGCYDRTLVNARGPLLIGVAYAFQELSILESESHDINLDCIITEKQIFYTSSRIQKLLD